MKESIMDFELDEILTETEKQRLSERRRLGFPVPHINQQLFYLDVKELSELFFCVDEFQANTPQGYMAGKTLEFLMDRASLKMQEQC